jgi:hypothetical protein
MSRWYLNSILTVIALLLGAIVAKLYLPIAQELGPQIAGPTRGELVEAGKIGNSDLRRIRLEQLHARMPEVLVAGGDVDVSGSNVTVDGEVSIARAPY